jgi:acyl-homoserine-lactone acylase
MLIFAVLRRCRRLFLLCLLFFPAFFRLQAQKDKTEILWDTYGVPHVFGQDIPGMYYGFGWAQMHNHANLLLSLYGQARGRAAEYWGQNYLASDKQVLLFNIPELGGRAYSEQNPEFRRYLDAFVKGVNAYAAAHPEAIGQEFRQVLPVTGTDVMAHCIRVLFLRFVGLWDIGNSARLTAPGSNSFAIAPSRSVSKHAMLVANPHLPWGDLYTFFEAHLQAPGFNAYGAAFVGIPVLNIAFNDHLGWTHTVNTIDASDRYELSLQDSGYILDGARQPFKTRSVVMKVRQADGTLQEQTAVFAYSIHGPVVGFNKNKAYAIRIAGMENPNILYQWHEMGKARDWKQFETALKLMQLPMFNVIYADAAGNILYLFDGNVPNRSEGDWKFWHATVDGTNSKYIWTQTLPYDSLPKVFDPGSGFIQNANDPPWNCTYPAVLDPKKFPAYMSPLFMDFRPQRAIHMIRNDSAISFDKLIGYKMNTEMEVADRFLPDLLNDVERYPDSDATKAAIVLQKWDRRTDSNSRGAVLFAAWYDKIKDSMFARLWDAADPLETPAGLNHPKAAVDLLSLAAKEVLKKYGSLDVPWGNVYRLRIDQLDLAASGGDGKYGIYRVLNYRKDNNDKYRASGGDTYVAVTEFGDKVSARVLLSYGNASQPGTRHACDQLSLLSQERLRPAWLTKEEIIKNLEEKEVLNETH